MPSSPIPFSALVIGSLIIALFAYGAYWAFQVRSVLVTRRYRDQALWVGASATFLALLVLSDILIGSLSPDNWYLSFLQFGISYLGAALTFAWVDSTLRVSRTADPLQRNTFHWAGLRKFGWIVLTISIIGGLVSVALRNTNYFTTPTGPQGAFLSGPFANLAIVCFPALVLSRRRVGDVVLQRHLRWLASFVIVLFFTVSLLNNPGSSIPRMIGGLLLIVDAFCVYMAAKSLAPLSHIAPEEVPPPMSIEGNVNPV